MTYNPNVRQLTPQEQYWLYQLHEKRSTVGLTAEEEMQYQHLYAMAQQ